VIKEPRALYEMIARIKPLIGEKTPVTVPQIWLEGKYIGGTDKLGEILKRKDIEPNADRGHCSLSVGEIPRSRHVDFNAIGSSFIHRPRYPMIVRIGGQLSN